MSIDLNRRLCGVALVAIEVCACSRGPATENREYAVAAEKANAGLVAPLKNDTREEIVSWVDGQVVTDWAAETAKRERAIDGYLNDTDPVRAEKYGFRSGQNPRLAWSWFRDNPVGFNGVPYVLFKNTFGADLCPDTSGLNPVTDRKEIEARLLGSRVGALLAYLKTL